VIELETRNALSRRRDCRFRELSQMATIYKGFQDILLDIEVVIATRPAQWSWEQAEYVQHRALNSVFTLATISISAPGTSSRRNGPIRCTSTTPTM